MSIPTNKLQYVSFSSELNYLHVVASGTVYLDDQTNNSILIPLPEGVTTPFFRVFQSSASVAPGYVLPVGGFFSTAVEADIDGDSLAITVIHTQGADTPTIFTLTYFIYGGNYGS